MLTNIHTLIQISAFIISYIITIYRMHFTLAIFLSIQTAAPLTKNIKIWPFIEFTKWSENWLE